MLPPPPKLDTLLASDSATNITLVSAHAGPVVSSSTGLPVIPGYEVLEHLGRGGMGRVFKARHLKLDRLDAIKMVAIGADESVIQRLIEEAKAIAKLKHPNIAQVYDSGEVGGQPFYAMELLEGGTLSQKLAGKPIAAREAAELVMTLARAVEYFHQQGILHRDLKPSNVLLTSKGELRIADFGLVKHLSGNSSQTQTGDVMGSPSYMAPEQATGQVKTLGPTVDIYALGAILYECLTGRPPFQTPEAVQTLMMVITLEPIAPRVLVPKLPRDINTICLKCLEKQPGKRYQRAEELAEDLHRFLVGEPIIARPVGRVEKTIKWCKRRPAWAAIIAAAVLTMLLFGLGYWQLNRTYLELSATKKQADLQLAGARALIDRMVLRMDDLAAIPHTEQVRQGGLNDARQMYAKLLNIKPTDLYSKAAYIDSCLKYGDIERTLGNLDKADQLYQQALDLLPEVMHESQASEHRVRYLQVLVIRANLALDRQQLEVRQRLLDMAEPIAARLVAGQNLDLDTAKTLAIYHRARGQDKRLVQQFVEAEDEYRKSLVYQQQAQQLDLTDRQAQEGLAIAHSTLASILTFQKKYSEAVKENQLAIELLPKLDHPQMQFLRAQFYSNQAVVLDELKRSNEADQAYRQSIDILKKLMLDFPLLPDYRYRWVRSKLNLARSLTVRNPKLVPSILVEVKPVLDQLIKDYPQQANFRAELKIWNNTKEIMEMDFKLPVK